MRPSAFPDRAKRNAFFAHECDGIDGLCCDAPKGAVTQAIASPIALLRCIG